VSYRFSSARLRGMMLTLLFALELLFAYRHLGFLLGAGGNFHHSVLLPFVMVVVVTVFTLVLNAGESIEEAKTLAPDCYAALLSRWQSAKVAIALQLTGSAAFAVFLACDGFGVRVAAFVAIFAEQAIVMYVIARYTITKLKALPQGTAARQDADGT
jgi:hypothetical protein